MDRCRAQRALIKFTAGEYIIVKLQRAQLALALLIALAGCSRSQPSATASQTKAAAAPRDELKNVVEHYYERYLDLHPLLATENGDASYNDRLVNDISEQAVADGLALENNSLQQLTAIDPAKLDDAQRFTYDMFKYERELAIEGYTFPMELLPLAQPDSVLSVFAQLGSGAGAQPFATVADYERFLKRVPGFVVWIDQAIANLKQGAAHGVVEPKVIVERVIAQCAELAADDPTKTVFYKPIANVPEQLSETDRARLSTAYAKAIREQITPAYRKLAAFLQKEYLPDARTSAGLAALPNGKDWYAHLVRRYTTTQLSAEQIYNLGRQELQRVRAEMDKVRAQVGSKEDLKGFLATLRADPRFNFTSAEEALQAYGAIKERVTGNLTTLFTYAPPGEFTSDVASRPRYVSEAIYLHEADPGHHLQESVQRSLHDLPRFRRFSQVPAYIEGWNLYAESLGRELGLYQDPYQYLGALMHDAGYAAQLVTDTGLHAKGWTRDAAIGFMKENTALSDADIATEVDRAIAAPGQALASKVGQLKIRELRNAAEKRLGPKFDVREFHAAILNGGAMPLDLLQRKIEAWIGAERQ